MTPLFGEQVQAENVEDEITFSVHPLIARWRHEAGSSATGNNSVCYNYKSGCFNDPTRINNPSNNCSFPIQAAAYNWSNPTVGDWFLKEVVQPSMVHADGIWLDGIGPDNGAYMCAGVCCGYGAENSPLHQNEIDAHCSAQVAATTKAQKWLIANGGWEAMRCFDYLSKETGPDARGQIDNAPILLDQDTSLILPTSKQNASFCAHNLQHMAQWGADHKNYNHGELKQV
jgi:hypothetical protein